MLTGEDLGKLYKQSVDQSFTAYLDNAKLNRFINEGFIFTVQSIYNTRLSNQNAFDEMSYLIAVNQTFPVFANTITTGNHVTDISAITNTGFVATITTSLPHNLTTGMRITFQSITGTGNITGFNNQTYPVIVVSPTSFTITATFVNTGTFTAGQIIYPDNISDYYHYLWAESTFVSPFSFVVSGSTNSSPINITLSRRSPLRDKDQVVISALLGNTAANGTWYVKQLNELQYALYSDVDLKVKSQGNGTQVGTGDIAQVVTQTMRFKRSDEKHGAYGEATPLTPFFQQGKNQIVVLPTEKRCTQIKMDYIRTLPFSIDVANTVIDLENFLPNYFWYKVVDQTAAIFSSSSRDGQLLQTSAQKLAINP